MRLDVRGGRADLVEAAGDQHAAAHRALEDQRPDQAAPDDDATALSRRNSASSGRLT